MNSNTDEISTLLTAVLIVMVIILLILVVVYVVLMLKSRSKKDKKTEMIGKDTNNNQPKTVSQNYNRQSIFSFMDFDKIDDNMIIRKKGTKFLMVIECQGINFDLMSGLEKNSVEQGFLQFLNTLRYPIQIYVQTRTVNLESGITSYKQRVKEIQDRLVKKQMEYNRLEGLGQTGPELEKAALEVTRERNLYEYGIDIIRNTERMSLNKNILRKHYYVIISYTPEDVSNLQEEEIKNMAFSELYTKAQSIIGALSVCGVNGKILDSDELAELLYIAYNRDESEIYDLRKAIRAEYDELYTTAPDVLDKRMKELDRKIEEDAIRKANDAVSEAMEESEKAKKVKQKEEQLDQLINQMAEIIIEENKTLVGEEVASRAKEKLAPRKRRVKKNEEK